MAYLFFQVQVNYLKGPVFFCFVLLINEISCVWMGALCNLRCLVWLALLFAVAAAVIPGLGADERHNLSTNFPHCRL